MPGFNRNAIVIRSEETSGIFSRVLGTSFAARAG
jgi:hypothetical protein